MKKSKNYIKVLKDRFGCPDPTMAEEAAKYKITELVKTKTDEMYEQEEKECEKYTKSCINKWIKKKQ